ncbi:hypothetical protein ACXWTF_03295 [Thiomicrolovo sp. ZZH C-3]
MKPVARLKHRLLQLLTLFFLALIPATPLQADTIDDIAWVLDQMGPANPYASQGLNGETLRLSKGLFECISDGKDVLLCVEEHENDPIGQTLTGQGTPSWFWDFLDLYAAFKNGDFQGVISHLGTTAICIVSQVLTGGVDVCQLLEELYALAEGMLDAASAVYEWAKDLGGAVLETLSGAYCSVAKAFGGCDEPDTPDFVIVYQLMYHPQIAAGVTARESTDANAFTQLLQKIEKDALHQPDPILPGGYAPMLIGSFFNPQSIAEAAKIYQNNVDTQWGDDIRKRVDTERRGTMITYTNPNNLNFMSLLMLQDYEKSPAAWNERRAIQERCVSQFRNDFGYAHVDRWLSGFPVAGSGATFGIKTNNDLCREFFDLNKEVFGQNARQYIVQKGYCFSAGDNLGCGSVDNYRRCLKLLTPFGMQERCRLSVKAAAAVKEEILGEFKKKGSSYYGPKLQLTASKGVTAKSFGKSTTAAVTGMDTILNAPLAFPCYRPSHAFYFDRFYQKYADLPQQPLQKSMQIDAEYLALAEKVKAAVDAINTKYANQAVFVGVIDPQRDPLVVGTGSAQDLDILKEDDGDYGFGGFTVASYMAFPDAIDGQDHPVIFHDMASKLKDALKKERLTVDANVIDGKIDPITKPGFNQKVMQAVTSPATSKQVFSRQKLAGSTQPQSAPTQPMSGTLPAGQQPKSGAKAFAKVSAGAQLTKAVRIEGGKQLTIAGTRAYWGRSVTLGAEHALSRANGTCRFRVEYTLQNRGEGSSGAYYRRWENRNLKGRAAEQRMNGLAAGTSRKVTETVDLVPGTNRLSLTLNSRGKSSEQQRYELTVNLTGNCAGRGGTAPLQRTLSTPPPAAKGTEPSKEIAPSKAPETQERPVKGSVFVPVR